MRVLFLESFYGGSHRDVADNIVEYSRHEVTLRSLPPRFWKWRSRGAALELVNRVENPAAFDLVVSGGLMSIADLRACWRGNAPPILLYAHETQLSYPVPDGGAVDVHYGLTDVSNMIAADHVAFNSRTHRNTFLTDLPGFLRRLPDCRPMWVVDRIAEASSVCHPGITVADGEHADGMRVDAAATDPGVGAHRATGDHAGTADRESPLIIWNHRWEFDKNPELLFATLIRLAGENVPFRVAVLGESFQVQPRVFLDARAELGDRIVAFGYVRDRREYLSWLQRGTVVVSTSIQENFGIAVLEAIAAGCHPLLPDRLSYPEIIPDRFHDSCLYESDDQLLPRLRELLTGLTTRLPSPALQAHAREFAWPNRISAFDDLFDKVASR